MAALPIGTRMALKLSNEYKAAVVQSYDATSESYIVVVHGASQGETVSVHESEVLTLQNCIREIQRDQSIDSATKAKAIQDIQMPPAITVDESVSNINSAAILTHKDAPQCSHYVTMCVIVAACCGRVFQCRVCHDEHVSTHKIDRFATSTIICKSCDTIQPTSNQCISCNLKFSDYYCDICKLWKADDDRGTFHCKDCGICRVGQAEHYSHCTTCGLCIPTATIEDHICLKDKYKQDCPVCRNDLLTSREPVVTMLCGHPIHQHCLRQIMTSGSFPRCPLCKKSVQNLDEVWERMQIDIDLQPMPPTAESGAPETVSIICNDCEESSPSVPFHFLGVRCSKCGSFNTAISGKASEDES